MGSQMWFRSSKYIKTLWMSGELSRQVLAGPFKIDLVVETDDEVLVNFIEETVVTVPRMREAGQDCAGNNGPVRLIV